ncbi:MAG: SiaC family regulatory phosphoprotein [Bacteroidota bacterium]
METNSFFSNKTHSFEHAYYHSMDILTLKSASCNNVESTYFEIINDVVWHLDRKDTLNIYIGFSRLNAVSIKCLINLFKMLNRYYDLNKKIKIYWSYRRNEDMEDLGLSLSTFCQFHFEIVSI